MDDAKQKLLTRIRESANVLVTVSNNPSLDQLAGAIGFTLLLNKLGKHGTAVFSGEVPSILEYLQPEATIEKTTDSLRDFIIALDKSKADKLRYKVEDKLVKIFITPYRTSLNEKDLQFSQGDFNVDVVVALGVHDQKDLDQAIVAHGRILHDATVASINNKENGELGTINLVDTTASSLCEVLYDLAMELKSDAIDAQMATALLTGIVSETKRFGNEKTTAKTLDTSSRLMALGANQQLVAARLDTLAAEEPEDEPDDEPAAEAGPGPEPPQPKGGIKGSAGPVRQEPVEPEPKADDEKADEEKAEGTLQVDHEKAEEPELEELDPEEPNVEEIQIDEHGVLHRPTDEPAAQPGQEGAESETDSSETDQSSDKSGSDEDQGADQPSTSRLVLEPPTLGGTLTANTENHNHSLDPTLDPAASAGGSPILSHATKDDSSPKDEGEDQTVDTALPEPKPQVADNQTNVPPPVGQTLSDIERSVSSPHQQAEVSQDNQAIDVQPALVPAEPPAVELPKAPIEPATEAAAPPAPDLSAARDAVMNAVNSGTDLMPAPRTDLNAAPILENLNQPPTTEVSAASETTPAGTLAPSTPPAPAVDPVPSNTPLTPSPTIPGMAPTGFTPPTPAFPVDNPTPFPSNLVSSDPGLPADNTAAPSDNPLAPPPVPPPMMPQGFVSPADEPDDHNSDGSNKPDSTGLPLPPAL